MTDVQQRTAEQLFKTLGELKGGAMKFGQALSIFESALPEELAAPYRAAAHPAAGLRSPDVGDHRAPRAGHRARHRLAQAARRVRRRPGRGRLDRPGAPRPLGRRPRGRGQGAVPRRRRGADGRPAPDQPGGAHRSAAMVPGHRHQAAGRRAAGPGRRGARLPARGRGAARRSPRRSAATPTSWSPTSSRTPTRCWSRSGSSQPASLARLIAEGTQEERDHYGEPLRPVPVRGPGPGRACCTPTRTPATSGCCPPRTARWAGSASSTTAPWPGCPRRACRARIGSLIRIATYDDYDDVLEGLRAEGFVKPNITIDPDELRDYLGPFVEPAQAGDVRVLPGLDARAVPAGPGPPPARVDARAAAEPAAVVPADPPGLGRRHRGALPARGRAAVPGRSSTRRCPGFAEA